MNTLAIYENNHSVIYQVGIKVKVENFRCCLVNTSFFFFFHLLHYHIMSTKTYVNISDSKKSSMVTIHETASPTISIKLDGANHCVWCQNLEMYIVGGR